MVYEVSRMPIYVPISLFVLYVVCHVVLAVAYKKYSEKEDKDLDKEKILKFFYRWFPAMYCVFIMLMFYFG